jgi:hypothetical protein
LLLSEFAVRTSPWWNLFVAWLLEPSICTITRVRPRIRGRRHLPSPLWGVLARRIVILAFGTFVLLFFAHDPVESPYTTATAYAVLVPLSHAARLKEADATWKEVAHWFPLMCLTSVLWRAMALFAAWYSRPEHASEWWYSLVLILFLVARHLVLYPYARYLLQKTHFLLVPIEVTTALCTAYQRDSLWSAFFVVFAFVLEVALFRERGVAFTDGSLWIQVLVLRWVGASLSPQFIRVMIVAQILDWLACGTLKPLHTTARDWWTFSAFLWCTLLTFSAF